MQKITAKSPKETKKIAADMARRIFTAKRDEAVVIALEGDLGSGKTTFVQGFAELLGVKENVLSPTFVLMKIYNVQSRRLLRSAAGGARNDEAQPFHHLVHIDCYRLDSPKDLLHLGFRELLKDKDAVILIEWADRIKKLLPRGSLRIRFKHGGKIHIRVLEISNF